VSQPYPSSPFEIEIQLTSRCNLKCGHCFGGFSSASKAIMPLKHVQQILDDMVERQIPRVTFSGGEPLLYPDLETCIRYAAQRDLDTRLLTNGSLITPELATTLVRSGLQSAAVSIDGDEKEHDRNRGAGRYLKALSAIASLRQAGLSSVSINLLVHSENYRSIDATIDELLGAGAKYVICLPLQLFGRARDRMHDKQLSPSQMLELYRRFERDSRVERRVFIHGPLGALMDAPPPRDLPPDEWEPCQAGQTRLSVSADGSCHPCIPIDPPLGNYFEVGLDRIWHEASFLRAVRDPAKLSAECRSCEYLPRCFGGCRVAAYYSVDSLTATDPQCFKKLIESGESSRTAGSRA
jgi:radical SAM protein with 4Fe4S-binding SPASM domain